MKAFLKTVPQRLRAFLNYILAGVVVLLISFLFPNNVKFKYNYTEGQPWTYSNLKSPFDFPILKSEEEINKEIASLKGTLHPYYELNRSIVTKNKQQFQTNINDVLNRPGTDSMYLDVRANLDQYLQVGNKILDSIYKEGILEIDREHQAKTKEFLINVLDNNTTDIRKIGTFFTTSTFNQTLVNMLSNCGLSNCFFLKDPLQELFEPNLFYRDSTTTQLHQQALQNDITYARGIVKKDQLIVAKGGFVTEDIYQQLESYKKAYEEKITRDKSANWIFLGYLLLTSLIMGVFVGFVKVHNPEIWNNIRQWLFLLMWIVIFSYAVYLAVKSGVISLYVLPFCIVPIIIKNFYNARLALFTHIIIVLIASFLSPLGYEFTFVQILAGIVVTLANVSTRYISKFFTAIFYILLVYQGAFLGLSLVEEGSINRLTWGTHGITHGWLALNVFLTLISYPLIPLLEKLFGFVSEITLIELSDLDKPLLRKLSINAPGTLQHSLQVANLSEAAANAIGANALLVKVAALYHDIGKTAAPVNFIENQSGQNPHDNMDEKESAKAIINHVTDGIKMAKKEGLPKGIINFIKSHHGTTRVEYFYRNYIAKNPDVEVDESDFCYPGPIPTSKEETILLVADSIEAASKSLKSPTETSINELVDNIVNSKINHGQFANSKLSFSELEICKQTFKKLLKSIYHVRIEYPDEVQSTKTA